MFIAISPPHHLLPFPAGARYDVEKAVEVVDQADSATDTSPSGCQGDGPRLPGACDLSEWGKHTLQWSLLWCIAPSVCVHACVHCSALSVCLSVCMSALWFPVSANCLPVYVHALAVMK